LTAGQAGDAPQFIPLLDGIKADVVLGDRAYDSDPILTWIADNNAQAVIPPHPRRSEPRNTDWSLYKARHKVEILFGMLKQFRRVSLASISSTIDISLSFTSPPLASSSNRMSTAPPIVSCWPTSRQMQHLSTFGLVH